MIVVDTSVWSEALRRPAGARPSRAAALLQDLIRENEPVAMPGIVYQELLSGIRDSAQFQRLVAVLEPFPVLLADRELHLQAAQLANQCRAKGVAASTPDALIAATAIRHSGVLLTGDLDFERIADCSSLRIQCVT